MPLSTHVTLLKVTHTLFIFVDISINMVFNIDDSQNVGWKSVVAEPISSEPH